MRIPGLGIFDSPILNRELRTLLRSRRAFLYLAVFLVTLCIAFTIAWSSVDFRDRDMAARSLFITIVATQLVLGYFLAPILTSGSIAGEQEQRTFELLATTPLSGYHVVLAKCMSALCFVLLLIIASMPILAVSFLIGGVGWAEVVASAIFITVTVLVTGMLGVVCSSWVRRTYIALMLSLMLVCAGISFCPCTFGMLLMPVTMAGRGGGGGSWTVNIMLLLVTGLYAGAQLLVFLALMHLARNGYLAGGRSVPVRPKRVIRSTVVLDERKRRFPYYLIDPLKAPGPIPDGANAVYIRDKRHQPLGRLDFVIRISYVCLFASIWIGLALIAQSDAGGGVSDREAFFEAMLGVSHIVVALILIASPLFAGMAFTSEKEHGTFVSMMSTLLTPGQIVWAKLKIILRYSLFLVGALFVPAFGELLFTRKASGAISLLYTMLWLLPFYVLVIVGSGLLGLLISARSRHNMRSLTATYLFVALFCFGPFLLTSLFEGFARRPFMYFGSNPGARTFAAAGSENLAMAMEFIGWIGYQAGALLGPILSPFYFLVNDQRGWINAMNCFKHPMLMFFYIILWLVVLAAMYFATIRALKDALHRSAAGGGTT